MGIQTFFSTIRNNKYLGKCVSERKISIHRGKEINGLFLDFNAIIHNITQDFIESLNKIYLEISKSQKFNDYSKVKKNIIKQKLGQYTDKYELQDGKFSIMLEELIIYEIGIAINKIMHDVFKSEKFIKIVYISIDGVPSKGKLVEQIGRSYSSQFVKEMNELILNKYKQDLHQNTSLVKYDQYIYEKTKFSWTKYHIQPGTRFMGNLSSFLKNKTFLSNIILKGYENKDLFTKIVLSDFREVGEGEIKVLNYIRYCIKEKIFNKGDIISVFSPDADVILLSSLIPFDYISNIKLFRYSDPRKRFKYWLVDIKKYKALLFNKIQNMSKIEINLDLMQRYIDDVVFIFSLFGDDFIPRMASYSTTIHFEQIFNSYVHVLEGNRFLTDTKNLTINNEIFRNFIRNLSAYENYAIVETYLDDTFENFRKWDNRGIQQVLSKYDEYWMIILNKSIVCYNHIKNIFQRSRSEEEVNNFLKTLNNTHSKYIDILYKDLIFINPHRILLNNENMNINLETEIADDQTDLPYNLKFFKWYYIHYKRLPRMKTLVLKKRYVKDDENKINKYNIVKKSFINMKDSSYFNWTTRLNKYENIYNKLGYIDGLKNISKNNLPYYYFSDELHFGKQFEKTKTKYYQKKLNIWNSQALEKCTKRYLNGLMWVFYSYNDVNNPLMNTWTYGYTHSPLLQDLTKFFNEYPNYDMNTFKNVFSNKSISLSNQYFTPFHKILYTTPIDGIIEVLPEFETILKSIYKKNLFENPLKKLGFSDEQIVRIKFIFNKLNFPYMQSEAIRVFNNEYNNVINCCDAMYISKCKFAILKKFHQGDNFDMEFISIINEIIKKLKFKDITLNNSNIPNFY